MKTFWLALVGGVFVVSGSVSCSVSKLNVQTGNIAKIVPAAPKRTMHAFNSDEELRRYFDHLTAKMPARSKMLFASPTLVANGVAGLAEGKTTDQDESITNVQHAGVDEGGIVKVHGNHLVILRRGRLFTVSVANEQLAPISSVDAFGPDIDPRNAWYDEMLVSDDTVAVIGYSYERGGTEVGLFHIDRTGNLAFRSTYHLRSNDYYSSRNYASRLIGNKLIFYSPLYLYPGSNDPFAYLPAVRKWHKGANTKEFQRIASASDIYRPEGMIDSEYATALHTVTTCDLARGGFDCKATSVIGPWGRVFYVSPKAVYVWVTSTSYEERKPRTASMLYRMPFDGSGPTALQVSGSPIDQFLIFGE